MQPTNRYGALAAWVYELDKPVGRSFGDIAFYRQRLAGCDGPILEPAVGNGRVMIPLLQDGHAVHGFDTSPEMLERCRQACRAHGVTATLSRQGFESFVSPVAFAAIVVPAGSFQLLVDPAAARAVLRRFRDALVPGGRLLLDLDPLGCLAEPPSPPRFWESGDDLLVLHESRAHTDFVRQTSVSLLRYEQWRSGRLAASELELFALRFWGVLEFELALREAGFADILVCGDYRADTPPDGAATVVTFEARAA